MANKQTERSRKMEKKVIIISDSEESEEYVLHENKKQEKHDIGDSEVATERRKTEDKQKPRPRKKKKKIISKKIINDSEESDDSVKILKQDQPNVARPHDKSIIYHQKPEFDGDRTFRKSKQQVIIIESESEESDDSDNKYVLHGNKKQKTKEIDNSEEATGSEDEMFLADRIRKVIFS